MQLRRDLGINSSIRLQLSTGDWLEMDVDAYDEHGITLRDEGDEERLYVPWTSIIRTYFTPLTD